MQRDRQNLIGYLLVIVSSLGFGTIGLWAKWGYQAGYSPIPLLVVRFGLASAFLWLAVLVRYRGLPKLNSRSALILLLQGGVGYALTAVFFFKALEVLPAGLTSMLFYLHPVITAMLASRLFKEQASSEQKIALLVAVLGSALLTGEALTGSLSLAGVSFALLAALAYSGFTLAGQWTSRLTNPLVSCAFTTTGCFLSLSLWHLPTPEFLRSLTPSMWGIGLGVALFATVIGILLYLAGVGIIGASRTAIVSAIEPASGVIFALIFLGESISFTQFLGIVAILIGVLLLGLGPMIKKRKKLGSWKLEVGS